MRNCVGLCSANWGTSTASQFCISRLFTGVLKILCWAVLLTCSDTLIEKKYEAEAGAAAVCLISVCGSLKQRNWNLCSQVASLWYLCTSSAAKLQISYSHHGHWRAMKCAMYRLFHQLKERVVIPLLFFMMILLPRSLRKKLGGRRNSLQLPSLNIKRNCGRQWARQKSPMTKCHCIHQWWSWTLSFCFLSWSQE